MSVRSQLGGFIPRSIKPFVVAIWVAPRKIGREIQNKMARIHRRPIFVVGNQKSGATAVAALLAEMTGMNATLDFYKESANPSYPRVRTGELPLARFLRTNKLSFSRPIVKEGNLTMLFPELAEHFPQAKWVFVVRDPRDNIRSLLNIVKLPGDLRELNDAHQQKISHAWSFVFDSRWLGLEGENYIELLAARWNYMLDVYLGHREEMILVRYEQFNGDKVGEIGRLADHLGLPRVNDIGDKVDVQYQPRGDRNVRWEVFFGSDNLSRIERICGERMGDIGYGDGAAAQPR